MNAYFEKMFGYNIRRIREQKNMTQEQLAAQLQLKGCDITRSALAKIEVGQRHTYPDEIQHLKNILAVSYEQLFDINMESTDFFQEKYLNSPQKNRRR